MNIFSVFFGTGNKVEVHMQITAIHTYTYFNLIFCFINFMPGVEHLGTFDFCIEISVPRREIYIAFST